MQRSACPVHFHIFTKSFSIISDICRDFVHFVQASTNRFWAVPRLSRSVSRRPLATETRKQCQTVHVGFMVNKVEVGEVFLAVLLFCPVSVIPQKLQTQPVFSRRRCSVLPIHRVLKLHD